MLCACALRNNPRKLGGGRSRAHESTLDRAGDTIEAFFFGKAALVFRAVATPAHGCAPSRDSATSLSLYKYVYEIV